MKKSLKLLAAASLLSLTPQLLMSGKAAAATIAPLEDAMWDSGGKYTTEPANYAGKSTVAMFGQQKAAIKFDLTSVSGPVTAATLRIRIAEYEDLSSSIDTFMSVYGSDDTQSWDGGTFWSTGTLLHNRILSPADKFQWIEFDVTSFIQNQMTQADRLVAFAFLGNTDAGQQYAFDSDNSANPPQLVVTVQSGASAPTVTGATTSEDTKSTSGLMISANGTGTTHYKITEITGGTLYKNDGTTVINNGDFITLAEGTAGLKYTPAADANTPAGGAFSFKVQASQDAIGTGLSSAVDAVVTVTEVNDAPQATNDPLTAMAEDSGERTIAFADLLGNDTTGAVNESGQTLTVKSVSNATGGTVSIDGTNVIFTPAANYSGAASFEYTVEDNGMTNGTADPKTHQATASFTINAKADSPSVTNAVTAEDTQSTTGLVITPNAVDGAEVTHFKISGITGGTLYKNDGTTAISNGDFITVSEGGAGLKFTPNADAHGTTGFGFNVQAAIGNDGTGLSDAVAAALTVTEVNDTPVATVDVLTAIAEDSGERIIAFAELTGNDSTGPANESGQTLTIKSVGNATGGTVRIEGTNVIFAPAANYSGAANFEYTVEDNGTTNGTADPQTDQATVSFTINATAEAPSVTNAETAEDTQSTTGLVITRDAADGAEVTHFKISGITGGTLYKNDGTTVINNGDFITSSEGGAGLKFTPTADAYGTTGFGFNVQAALGTDGSGLSDAVAATITVTEVNEAPVAADDALTAVEEDSAERTIAFADLLGNDAAGSVSENGQTLTIKSVSNATGGTVRIEGTNVIFTPAANYSGAASFEYTVEDNGTTNGTADPQTDQATVSFTINATPEGPSVTNAVTAEDTQSTTGLVITRDAADGAEVTHFKISGITGGTLYKNDGTTAINNGDFITVSEGGAGLKFTPNADAYGTTGFGFKVQAALGTDGTGLSDEVAAEITVTEVNDAPDATDDTLTAIQEDSGERTIAFADLLANDTAGSVSENGQTLTINAVNNATGGTVRIEGTNVIFTPAANYSGAASFEYTVEDNGTTNGTADAKTDQATVSFTIDAKADTPSVTNAVTAEDTQGTTGLVITPNVVDGAEVTHFKISGITGGTLYKNDGTTAINNGDFITVSEGGAGLKFTPTADTHGTTGFGFNVQASKGTDGTNLSDEVAASITVTEVNDAPVASDDVLTAIQEDSAERTIAFADLLGNDTTGPANESGQTLTIKSVSNATGGTVRIEGTNVIFTPAANYSGAASFEYTVEDNGTTNVTADPKTDQATVSFTIDAKADSPSVTNAVTAEDTQSTSGLVITRNAVDGTEVTHFKISGITGGTLYKNDGTTAINNGDFITVSEGGAGLKFTPTADTHGTTGYGFNVQASQGNDGTNLSDEVAASITVTEVNDAPVATDDSLTSVQEDSAERTIAFADLLGNDATGPANESDQTLTIKSVGNATGGAVRIEGTDVIFTPAANYSGAASFEYTVEDNGTTNGTADPKTDQATVSFTIDAKADSPSVTNAVTAEDTQSTSGLVITRNIVDGAEVTHFKITGITGGTLYQNDGTTAINNGDFITVSEGVAGLKFTPAANTHGMTGFGFNVQASHGTNGTELSDEVAATVTVTEVNDMPVATGETLAKVAMGTPKVTIPFADLIGNDLPGPADEQAQSLTITDVSGAQGGTVSIVGSNVEFVPDANFQGTVSFTYTVRDNGQTGGVDDYKTTTATAQFDVADEVQPVITLHGDQTQYLLVGTPYAEPGYAAQDDVDQDLTNQVTVTGTVDTSAVGTYVLRYNVSDNSGNAAQEVTRTVQVVSTDLVSLSTQVGAVVPPFTPDKENYTSLVSYAYNKLVITANAADPTSTVTINGVATGSDGRGTVNLNVGQNDITIVVTAQGGATKTYTLKVTRQPAPANGGGTPANTRQAKVVTGQGPVVQVDITRTQEANGNVIDSVVMQGSKADEVVAKAAADKATTASIIIDDLPEKPADEVTVNVSSVALGKLKTAELTLAIEASGARITLDSTTIGQLSDSGDDLYFRVVPIRKPEVEQEVEDRVSKSPELREYADGRTVLTVGKPMTIHTNYTDRKTKVMFPLNGMTIPTNPKERTEFLNGLAVFVEHSDGEKEVEKGQIIYNAAGVPVGIEIEIEKFSTFTIISTDEFKTYLRYVSGYPDGTFHPNAEINRAELAVVVAKLMADELASGSTMPRYPDVSESHWASKAIAELTAAGILVGDDKGTFRPSESVTRAQMAVIAAKLKGLDTSATTETDQDTAGHWAAGSIAAVKQAGLMVGFEDGSFRPNQTLTRAEAVTVLNQLFERPELTNSQPATWPDVPLTHWASSNIESASNDLRELSDGRIEKIDSNE